MGQAAFDTTDHNARMFFDPKLAALYAGFADHPAEETFRRRHAAAYRGKRMLDLGVGSGRTTRQFLPAVSRYLGVDISEPMLAVARDAFPQAEFQLMDVRAIGGLGRGEFDFVLGAWAILSAFSHDERLTILAAVHDLLSPGGMFYFSAHNRHWRRAGGGPLHSRSWRPRQIVESVHPLNWYNYLRLRHLRREETEYAILNDSAHNWNGLFYYIDPAAQARQLAAAGFRLIDSFGENGRVLQPGESVAADALLHYVCVRD